MLYAVIHMKEEKYMHVVPLCGKENAEHPGNMVVPGKRELGLRIRNGRMLHFHPLVLVSLFSFTHSIKLKLDTF